MNSSDNLSAAEADLFQAVPREATLANRVTGQVEALIVEGRLQPGQRLPSERELADQFGVSRTVVREAVRGLVAKGLLEVRPGSGTLIRSPSAHAVSQSLTLFLRASQPNLDYTKIHEIRRVLEVEIAGLAAERRTAEDLAWLERILAEMAAIHDNRDRFAQSDMAFHNALASATHNELFVLLLESVVDMMLKVRQIGFDVPSSPANALKFHRAIYDRVRAGDPAGAHEAMRLHLIDSEEVMRQALTLRQGRGD